jgi:hypothetical protein
MRVVEAHRIEIEVPQGAPALQACELAARTMVERRGRTLEAVE